jgi:Kelch motif
MEGITDVCDLYRGFATYLTPESTTVASWDDGEIFVAVKDNRTVASLNMYVGTYYQYTGQAPEVVHNAILWLSTSVDVPWLSESPITGTVPALGLPLGARLVAQTTGVAQANPGLTVSSPSREVAASPEAPANPAAVLWDQPLSTVNQNAYVNQEFSDFPTFSTFLADDFISNHVWGIDTIFVPGDGWNGFSTLISATVLTWAIYADCAGVPCGDPSGAGVPPVWSITLPPTDPAVVISTGTPGGVLSNSTLNLPAPVLLPPGHYWFIFYPTMSFALDGQYGRQPAVTTNGFIGQAVNPGGGFGVGTGWQNWMVWPGSTLPDMAFRLEGDIIDADNFTVVDVTFDAGVAEVTQPGDYFAQLKVKSNTPYLPTTIPVTMTVVPPPTYGKLDGTVQSLGYCDLDPQVLKDATVFVEGSTGLTWTLTTDASGYYQVWMDQANTPVTIHVNADQHVGQDRTGVTIVGQQTTTENFDLHWLRACVHASPENMAVAVNMGATTSLTLTIGNTGAADTPFALREQDRGYTPTTKGWIEYLPEAPATDASQAVHNGPVKAGVESRRSYIFHGTAPQAQSIIVYCDDDQHSPSYIEQALMDLGLTYTFYGNPSDPGPLDQFTNDVNAGGWDLVILAQDGWIYLDAREYTAVQNHILAGGSAIVYSWGIGYSPTQSGHGLWPAMGANYVSWLQSPENLYWWDPTSPIFEGVPEFTDLTNLGYLAYGAKMDTIEDVADGIGGFTVSPEVGQGGVILSENFKTLYRGLSDNLNSADSDGDGAPDAYEFWLNGVDFMLNPAIDVIWLSENPVTGTLPATVGVQDVTVTFDSSVVPQPGVYYANLSVKTDDPVFTPVLPITMTVNPTPDYGILVGNVTGLGYCDTNPAPLEGAVILIESASGVTYTVETDANGNYSRWLQVADGPYIVSVTAAEHSFDLVSDVEIVSLGTTTVDFELRWLEPCLSTVPPELVVDVPLGYQSTVALDLLNDGAVSSPFKISEKPGTPVLKSAGVGDGKFSAPAAIGPTSVRSTEGRAALASQPGQPDAWLAGADIPMGVVRYAKAQCADQPDSFYIIGGVDESFSVTDQMVRYDADTDSWTTLAAFPSPVEGPNAVCYEGFIYVAGGDGSNQFYIYDVAGDSWTPGPALPRGVWGAAVGAWDGFVYVAGGDSDFYFGGTSNEVDIYDIAAGAWIGTGTPMPTPRSTPGQVQAGQYLYVVGGWGDDAPAANSTATERYDMSADTWETGPSFDIALADGALAVTSEFLYALGGDANGGGAFDASDPVYVLAHADWPGGAWTDAGDPLPLGLTANNGGFCTSAVEGGEVWSTAGIDLSFTVQRGNNYRPSEGCFSGAVDVPWLAEDPITGTVAHDGSFSVDVTFTAFPTMTVGGVYTASLNIKSDDPVNSKLVVPVTMNVVEPVYGVEVSADQTGSGEPGGVVTYTVTVTNTSNFAADTFTVTLGTHAYTTTVGTAVVGPVAMGESATFVVTVTIPADALDGDHDAVQITVTSAGDPTKTATTTVTTNVVIPPPTNFPVYLPLIWKVYP